MGTYYILTPWTASTTTKKPLIWKNNIETVNSKAETALAAHPSPLADCGGHIVGRTDEGKELQIWVESDGWQADFAAINGTDWMPYICPENNSHRFEWEWTVMESSCLCSESLNNFTYQASEWTSTVNTTEVNKIYPISFNVNVGNKEKERVNDLQQRSLVKSNRRC